MQEVQRRKHLAGHYKNMIEYSECIVEIPNLTEHVSVDCNIGTISSPNHCKKIGYFKVCGQYKAGSEGYHDAIHIQSMISYAFVRCDYNLWIVDLSELEYESGDDIELVFGAQDAQSVITVAYVLGLGNVQALASLLDWNDPESQQNMNLIFLDVNEAYEHMISTYEVFS